MQCQKALAPATNKLKFFFHIKFSVDEHHPTNLPTSNSMIQGGSNGKFLNVPGRFNSTGNKILQKFSCTTVIHNKKRYIST